MLALFLSRHGLEPTPEGWAYGDLIVVILTAVGVLIATLGIGIAIIAMWGYAKIADHAVEESIRAMNKRLDEMSASDLKERINSIGGPKIEEAADDLYKDIIAPKYPSEERT